MTNLAYAACGDPRQVAVTPKIAILSSMRPVTSGTLIGIEDAANAITYANTAAILHSMLAGVVGFADSGIYASALLIIKEANNGTSPD